MVTNEAAADIVIQNLKAKGVEIVSRDNIIADIKAIRERIIKRTKDVTKKWMKLPNSAGDNPYLFKCPWCEAKAGCLCQDLDGKDYKDGSYHRARLMKDCLDQDKKNVLSNIG